MKKVKNIFMLGATIAMFASCSVSGPILVTDNAVNTKTGEASFNVWLGFIRPMHADISIKTAAKNGGITKIASVDSKMKSGFFKSTYSTVVTGE